MKGVAFLFSAIETPWPGMGRYLSEYGGVVDDVVERGEAYVRRRLGVSLRAVMASDDSLPEALLAPINTLAQIALSAAWKERGLQPDALICRCGGEFAAAYVADAVAFEDALEPACRLADVVDGGKGRGKLIVVDLSCEAVLALGAECPARYEVITEATTSSAVVGCSMADAATVFAFFASRNISAHATCFATAWHTRSVDGSRSDMLRPLAEPTRAAQLPIYSATTRGLMPLTQDWTSHFWRVVRTKLSIRAAIGAALDDGISLFVEVGAQPTLRPFVESEAAARGLSCSSFATMERNHPLRATMDETLAGLGALAVCA